MKQMFDISEKLTSERSDEIYGVKTSIWEDSLWKYLPLIGDEQVTSLQRTKHIVCRVLERRTRTLNQILHGKTDWRGSKVLQNTETLDLIDGEPMDFEWNIFPGFTALQLSHKAQEPLLRLNETPENFTGRIFFMSMFKDISWGSKDNEKDCKSNAQLVSLFAKRCGAGQWSFLGLGSERKWYILSVQTVHNVNGTELQNTWCWLSQKADM